MNLVHNFFKVVPQENYFLKLCNSLFWLIFIASHLEPRKQYVSYSHGNMFFSFTEARSLHWIGLAFIVLNASCIWSHLSLNNVLVYDI